MPEQWEERLSLDFENKSPLSKIVYATIMRKFTPSKYDKWEVLEFLKSLKAQKYSDNYRRLSYYCIKKRFELEEKEWPFKTGRGNLPTVDISEVHTPVMETENVEKLITWSKSCDDSRIQGIVVLSTIYGLRRTEILSITKDNIVSEENGNHFLNVKAAKGGEKRNHIIPAEIQPYLIGYGYHKISLSWLSQLFGKICKWSGITTQPREGFHSIRRALATELESKAPLMLVWDFLRWKKSALAASMGLSPMLGTYFHKKPEEIDTEIFKVHPFLTFWK